MITAATMIIPKRRLTAMTMANTTTPEIAALLTLAQWLSPAYPVGAFAYSHGLEWAVGAGDVTDSASFQAWITAILQHGSGRNDAILLAAAYNAPDDLENTDDTARAFAASRERLMETELQGAAFVRTVNATHDLTLPELCYPVAVGAAARALGLPLDQTLPLYLHGFAANLTSAAIRLVPLGQTDGQATLARLAPICQSIATTAAAQTLDDLGGACILGDIAAMQHETQYTRLFRS